MWFESLHNYLGSRFYIEPGKAFVEKVEKRKEEFLGRTTVVFVRNIQAEKLMAWAWLYARGFLPMYSTFIFSEFIDAKLSGTEKERYMQDSMATRLIAILPDMPLSEWARSFIPLFMKQRDFMEGGETLFLVYESLRAIVPTTQGYKILETSSPIMGRTSARSLPKQEAPKADKPVPSDGVENGEGVVEPKKPELKQDNKMVLDEPEPVITSPPTLEQKPKGVVEKSGSDF